MRILSCMNASNPDIPEGVFEDPRSGRLVQQRVVLMMTGVNFNWLDEKDIEGEAEEANIFSGISSYRVTMLVADRGRDDLDLGSSSGWLAVTLATYCLIRTVEHPIYESTQPRFATNTQGNPAFPFIHLCLLPFQSIRLF